MAVGCALAAIFVARDTRVPGTSYVVSHRDVMDSLPAVLAAVVIAAAIVVCSLVLLNNRSHARTNRPAPRVRPVSPWMLLVAPCVIAVSGWAYEQATPMGPNVTTLIYYVGVLCCTPGSPQALTGGVVTGLRALGDLVGSSAVVVRVADPTSAVAPADVSGWTTTLLARADGGPLPIGDISDTLAAAAVPAPRVETLAQSWLVAADDLQVKGRWVVTFGTYAVAAAAVALAAAAAEFARMGLSSALWAAMGARRRVYVAISAWRILLPMLVASAVGFAAAAWLARPLLAPAEGGHLSTPAVLAELAVVGIVSIGVWLLSARRLLRDAQKWRPATD